MEFYNELQSKINQEKNWPHWRASTDEQWSNVSKLLADTTKDQTLKTLCSRICEAIDHYPFYHVELQIYNFMKYAEETIKNESLQQQHLYEKLYERCEPITDVDRPAWETMLVFYPNELFELIF
jgi:hypothetical protein